MLKFTDNNVLLEDKYEIEKEPLHSALFTTGNGYIGVRGSFEEFGSLRIQGTYIRGLFDEIIEVIEPFMDNEYMRKYYFDEEKLKDFEKQDSIINIADFLLVRISIGDKVFYPWEGKIISWKRYLDTKTAKLVREVEWDDGQGNKTEFVFERFSSMDDKHIYALKVKITPINHNQKIKILSGIDTKVKTGGQRIICPIKKEVINNHIYYHLKVGNKYHFESALAVVNNLYKDDSLIKANYACYDTNGLLGNMIEFDTEKLATYTLEKIIYINTTRDYNDNVNILDIAINEIRKNENLRYSELFKKHLTAWNEIFSKMDITIKGDHEADSALRFANYHTLLSAPFDDVHSLSAKSLSGERYNNFVWWDAEIYQLPIFIYTYPEIAKNALLYRYRLLDQARKNASEKGYKGARYPFVSSVLGDEKVWIYARHPFLQIHITADIAYAIIHYYTVTKDKDFMINYGIEMLIEILRYWQDRVTYTSNRYEIHNVTGTDEHHPYINNNAYTNYLVKHIFKESLNLLTEEFKGIKDISKTELNGFIDICEKLYLPITKDGLIPQFDGYFSLSRSLEIAGIGTGKDFQMKESGLYHKSQIIKQPDVMLLYSYINTADVPKKHYALNWDYYEQMCETSSSLTHPVHAICSIDNNRILSFYNYFMNTLRVDLDDIHNNAWQGVHSGCLAGGWYAIFRGLLGIVCKKDLIEINPKVVPWWDEVSLYFNYQGNEFRLIHKKDYLEIIPQKDNQEVVFRFKDEDILVKNEKVIINI